MNSKGLGLVGLVLALLLFAGINLLSKDLFRSARIDLTAENLYTLSEGSRKIVEELEEPVRLRYFYSENLAAEIPPQLVAYAERVRELLEEYVSISDGKVILEIYDPEPFSEEEDMAVGYRLFGQAANARNDQFFFGLVGTNSVDDQETIPFFAPNQESTLEYDITKLIHTLGNVGESTIVGLVSALPIAGAPANPFGQGGEAWGIHELLTRDYELRDLGIAFTEIAEDIDILLMVHPKGLSDQALFAVDQFVLKGGRVMAFLDAHCEQDRPITNPQNPMQGMQQPRNSDLGALMKAWGVELTEGKLVGDSQGALMVNAPTERGMEPMNYLLWFSPQEEGVNQEDFATSGLKDLTFATAGELVVTKQEGLEATRLIESSSEVQLVDEFMVRFRPDPKGLLKEFVSEGSSKTLAVRLSGTVKTAFPDGKPEDPSPPEEGAEEEEPKVDEPALSESKNPTNIILVSDADMLFDQFCLNVIPLPGQKLISLRGQNASFLLNGLENLSGDNNLISLRARGNYNRPFERVLELRRQAQEKYYDKEKEIEDKIQKAEQDLQQLQFKEITASGEVILSDEQQEKIRDLNEEMVQLRKERRDISYELDKDVKSLGIRLKVLNIALVPAAVLLVGLGTAMFRAQRRRRSS